MCYRNRSDVNERSLGKNSLREVRVFFEGHFDIGLQVGPNTVRKWELSTH